MSAEPKVYMIPAVNFERLGDEIKKMNKKAVKLKTKPITLTLIKSETKIKKDMMGLEYQYVLHHCTVTGETPKLHGWTLVAILEPQDNGEKLVREVPGQHCPIEYRTTDMHCDHCMTTRRRSVIYVLKNDEGHKQVGKQCLSDFLGGENPEDLVAGAQYLMDFAQMASDAEDDGWCRGGKMPWIVPIHHFVAMSSIIIRRMGWVPRSKASVDEWGGGGVEATANIAWRLCLWSNDKECKKLVEEKKLHVEERDGTLAEEAINWGKGIDPTNATSTYLHDLGVCCRQEYVTHKTSGFVASVINAYLRAMGDSIAAAKPADRPVSQHVGEIKKREVFTGLKIVKMVNLDGEFPTTLVKFEDEKGNVLVWKASGCPDWLEMGKVVTVKATVDQHTEFRGINETKLKRVSPESVEVAA